MSAQMSADRDLGLNKQAFIGRFKAPDTAAPFYAITNHLYTTAYKQTNVVALSRCRRYKHVPEASGCTCYDQRRFCGWQKANLDRKQAI